MLKLLRQAARSSQFWHEALAQKIIDLFVGTSERKTPGLGGLSPSVAKLRELVRLHQAVALRVACIERAPFVFRRMKRAVRPRGSRKRDASPDRPPLTAAPVGCTRCRDFLMDSVGLFESLPGSEPIVTQHSVAVDVIFGAAQPLRPLACADGLDLSRRRFMCPVLDLLVGQQQSANGRKTDGSQRTSKKSGAEITAELGASLTGFVSKISAGLRAGRNRGRKIAYQSDHGREAQASLSTSF
jgi:hypothetical protein